MSITDEALLELAVARDEARLRAHLLSMDARARWRELEAKLDGLEQKLAQGGDRAAEAGLATARHLAHSVAEFLKTHAQPGIELTQPVQSIMSRVLSSCAPTDSLNRAAQLLWESDCGVLPVVDADGLLLGVITDRDVCMASYIQGGALTNLPVERAMSGAVKVCSASDGIARVLEVMQISQVRRVPIVEENGRLIGIVSLADVARWIDTQRQGRAAACDALARTLAAISRRSATAEGSNSVAE